MTVQWEDYVIENPPAVSDAQVHEVEWAIGRRLPQDYLRVARLNQGRTPEPGCFDLADGDRSCINSLLVFEEGHSDYIPGRLWLMEGGRPNSGPSVIVPFAWDAGGSLICFDYRSDPENPTVVFWDHEANAKRRIQTIASSFTDLLDKLHE